MVIGNNLLENSESLVFQPYSGAELTSEDNIVVEEWNTSEAKRIYGTGAEDTVAYIGFPKAFKVDADHVFSLYVKNIGKSRLRFGWALHFENINVEPNEIKRISSKSIANLTGELMRIYVSSIGTTFDLDFIYWRPKVEVGTHATPWCD